MVDILCIKIFCWLLSHPQNQSCTKQPKHRKRSSDDNAHPSKRCGKPGRRHSGGYRAKTNGTVVYHIFDFFKIYFPSQPGVGFVGNVLEKFINIRLRLKFSAVGVNRVKRLIGLCLCIVVLTSAWQNIGQAHGDKYIRKFLINFKFKFQWHVVKSKSSPFSSLTEMVKLFS